MMSAGRTVLIFGIYMIFAGIPLLLAPAFMLGLFLLDPPDQLVWVRFLGLFIVIVGIYFIEAGRSELTPFIRLTVPMRVLFGVVAIGFVIVGWVGLSYIAVAGFDLAGAVWTGIALRDPTSSENEE